MESSTATSPVPRCGICRYDLSGAPAAWRDSCPLTGACPECGAAFAWKDAFAGAALAPAWLFEYAPRAGPRAWLATAARVPLVWRLFDEARGVHPAVPVLVPRAVGFALGSALFTHTLVALLTTLHTLDRLRPTFAFGTPPQRSEAAWRLLVPLVWPYGGWAFTKHWSYRAMLGTAWWWFILWAVLIAPAAWLLLRGAAGRDTAHGGWQGRLLRVGCYASALVAGAMVVWCGAFTAYVMGLWPRSSGLSSRMTGLVYSAYVPASLTAAWTAWLWLGGGVAHVWPQGGRGARLRMAGALVLAALVAWAVVCCVPGNTLWPVVRWALGGE